MIIHVYLCTLCKILRALLGTTGPVVLALAFVQRGCSRARPAAAALAQAQEPVWAWDPAEDSRAVDALAMAMW